MGVLRQRWGLSIVYKERADREKKVRCTVCAGDQVKRKSRVRFKLFNHGVA